jgi:hypothetical protein
MPEQTATARRVCGMGLSAFALHAPSGARPAEQSTAAARHADTRRKAIRPAIRSVFTDRRPLRLARKARCLVLSRLRALHATAGRRSRGRKPHAPGSMLRAQGVLPRRRDAFRLARNASAACTRRKALRSGHACRAIGIPDPDRRFRGTGVRPGETGVRVRRRAQAVRRGDRGDGRPMAPGSTLLVPVALARGTGSYSPAKNACTSSIRRVTVNAGSESMNTRP